MLKKKPFKILVGLDLSEMDVYLLEYMHTLDRLFEIESVTFLHNIKLGELSIELLSSGVLKKIYAKIKTDLQNSVERVGLTFSYRVEVQMESLSEKAFEQVYRKDKYDLLVVGRKQKLSGNGALAYKLVRLFPGATMFVPETFRTPIKVVVEAITFSKYTKSILGWGTWFRQNQKVSGIAHWAVHVSKPFYAPFMGTLEREQVIQMDIEKKREKWQSLAVGSEEFEIISAQDQNISSTIQAYLSHKKADVLILGVKSNSKIRELFMGSVANELLQHPSNVCLLFVKPLI